MKYLVVIIMGAVFIGMVWLFCVRNVEVLWRQHQAESFSHTPGQVESSEVTITHGSKGSIHYHVYITYSYLVNGHGYRGGCYRYDGHPGDANEVRGVVAAHPAGSVVEVYYNPQDPAESVLSPLVDARDIYDLFLFTPLSLFMLWVMANAAQNAGWGGSSEAGGVKVITEMMVTRVRLPRFGPFLLGLPVLCGLSFIGGILMATGVLTGPPLTMGGWLLLCVVLGGAAAYGWQFSRIHSGSQDLVIDEGVQTILLPLTYKRRTQSPVSFSEIQAVALKKIRHQNRSGVSYTYMVTLQMKDGSLQNLINLNQARAESFALWLKQKFGFTGETAVLNPET
ncbi:MAG TPA: DUF3592 domain-containing protein [Verrucomicrobiae bacterium]|jgi:hypothetical protein